MKKLALIIAGGTVLFGASLELVGCDDSSSSPAPTASSSGGVDASSSSGGSSSGGSSSGGSSGASTSGGIVLSAADKDSVTPCPTQDALKDATQLTALKTALTTGTLTYLDIPYDANDADILKKKCGVDGFWDPTKNTATIPVTGTPTILDVVQTGNGGICATGFTNFGTDDGFPAATTYRKELKAASGGSTYHVRVRITASGSAAGKKFSDIPLTKAELGSKLTYQVNGTASPHDDVWTAVVNAFAAPAPSATVDAQNAGATIFSAKIELICAAKQ